MIFIYLIFDFFLLFHPLTSSDKANNFNLSIGVPLNITKIDKNTNYIFNIEAQYSKEITVKIIIPNMIMESELLEKKIYLSEWEDINTYIGEFSWFLSSDSSIKYNPDGTIKILFDHSIRFKETNLCLVKFMIDFDVTYFYIVADLAKPYEPYELNVGTTQTFHNIEFFRNYFFITGVKRFQRINVTITAQSLHGNPFDESFKINEYYSLYIREYINKTEDYLNYNDYKREVVPNQYNYEIISEVDKIYSANFFYGIGIYSTIAITIKFPFDLNFLSFKVEAYGGEIPFYDNDRTKNITDLKAKYPYCFFTKTTEYQITSITLITKYDENLPFDDFYILEYNENSLRVFYTEEKIETIQISNKSELIISYSYQMNLSYITDIGFRFIPKYNLDYLFVKMDIMGGTYYLNDEDIQKFYNVYPGYEIFFWIKSLQYDTTIINLKFNYLEGNPLNDIDIYEYKYYYNYIKYYKNIKQSIIPININNTKISSSFSYTTEYSDTNYVLLKINPKLFLEYFEIKVNTHKKFYDLISCDTLKINNINPGNLFYFFINATIYNKLFFKLSFGNININPVKYLTINEYENRNILTYIKSTNQTFDLIKTRNESNMELTYIPKKSSCNYVGLILEANSSFNYLMIQVDVGGGYYEFNKDKNITKIIAGTAYYFPIRISPVKKLEMKIFIDDTGIDTNPFTFANIYEKEKKDDISYNKYYNLTLTKEIIEEKLVEYFTYPVDNFSTNYILIELIPNINLEKILITYELININTFLSNGESNKINKVLKNIPYYYFINSKQYQQVKINFSINNLQPKPFEFLEIYEYSDIYRYNEYKRYTNKSIKFINNDNNQFLTNSFTYMIDSFYTKFILIKIKPILEIDFLEIKVNVGGGYYAIDKGLMKNLTNLFAKYSYYFFVISSKEEKLNIKFIVNTNEIKKPFNSLNILEYSNKNTPSIYSKNLNKEYKSEIKDNDIIITLSYSAKNQITNFIALEVIPDYNLNSIQCLVETEVEVNNPSSFTLVKILIVILIIIIIFTLIVSVIYIKKVCLKSSSNEIENLYLNKNNNDNKTDKKFELALLPEDTNSSLN